MAVASSAPLDGSWAAFVTLATVEAQKAHNCQASASHRLARGDKRLKVRNGRSWDHYCVSCAAAILERDIAELQQLQIRFQTQTPGTTS